MAALRCGVVLVVLAFPVSAAAPPAYRWDGYGERLPDGAIARLGSFNFRHEGTVGRIAFSHDSRKMATIASTGKTRTLWLWDVRTARNERRFPIAKEADIDLCWSPDGQSVFIADPLGVSRVSITTGTITQRFKSHMQRIRSMALSPDGKILAVGCASPRLGSPSTILVWDALRGKELKQLKKHQAAVDQIAFSADGKSLFSRSEEDRGGIRKRSVIPTRVLLCTWKMPSGELLHQLDHASDWMAFAPDGRTMTIRGEEEQIQIADLRSGKIIATLPDKQIGFLYLPDGKSLVTGGDRCRLCLWDAVTGKRIRRFEGHHGKGVWPAAISPDSKILVSRSFPLEDADSVRLWDVATGAELHAGSQHRGKVTCLVLSLDDKTLVSGGEDQTVRIWDVRSGKLRALCAGHRGTITALAFSPDGKTLATGDEMNAIHLWNPATGKLLHRVTSPSHPNAEPDGVRFLFFTADGKKVIAGSRVLSGEETDVRVRGDVSFWRRSTGKREKTIKDEDGEPLALVLGGQTLISIAFLPGHTIVQPRQELRWQSLRSGNALFRIKGRTK